MAKPIATELDASLLVRKGEVPESAKPPSQTPPEGRINFTYRPRISMHEKLRNRGHAERRKIQEMIDEAVERWMEGWDG